MQVDASVRGARVPVSSDRLRRIVVNLVENATSFSPEPGSVEVALSLGGDHAGSSGACMLLIRVRDRGPGICPDVFDHITERFYTYRPNVRNERHSGLGLAIVEAIARECGGSLTYRNRDGGGAEFLCSLPVVTGERVERA